MRLLIAASVLAFWPHAVGSHGYAGNRYFPATMEVEDPFAAYEIHAVAGKRPRSGDPDSRRSNSYSLGGGIEPVDGFGISLDATYRAPNPDLSPARDGFDNLALTVKKELAINAEHEYAISVGVGLELGGTGSSGAASGLAYAPTLYYAKGFGDLPDTMKWLRPFAVTGVVAYETPAESGPRMLNWGFTVQYSLLYLQSRVGNLGLREPFSRLIPVVEVPVRTCLSSECSGQTTGTINPGVVWVGKRFNLSLEAVVPINSRSGHGTGVMIQFHQYLAQ